MAAAFCACEPADSNKETGFPLIYIPQATVTGLDNTYPIPNGALDQYTNYVCRYNQQSGALEIALGAYRAGYLTTSKGFTVDLGVCQSETERKLSELESAMALPLEYCTIPEKITVEEGKNSGSCYVSVNMKALAAKRADIMADDSYKLLVLGLQISNPTAYELAQKNTSVVIVLDLNSSHWDNAPTSMPESQIRTLFPIE